MPNVIFQYEVPGRGQVRISKGETIFFLEDKREGEAVWSALYEFRSFSHALAHVAEVLEDWGA